MRNAKTCYFVVAATASCLLRASLIGHCLKKAVLFHLALFYILFHWNVVYLRVCCVIRLVVSSFALDHQLFSAQKQGKGSQTTRKKLSKQNSILHWTLKGWILASFYSVTKIGCAICAHFNWSWLNCNLQKKISAVLSWQF